MSISTAQLNTTTILATPKQLKAQQPLSDALQTDILRHREEIKNILSGNDPRVLVIVGPCSIHDPVAVYEYAQRLKVLSDQHRDTLKIVMRAYLEKPRSTVGWKGYVYDPHLDGSYDLANGLQLSRKLLIQLAQLGLPLATEVLNPLLTNYLDDLYAWGAVGARTSESQIHREISSRLDYPIGFKNGTDGNVNIALDAIQSASQAHHFLGMSESGQPASITSSGNKSLQIILRGGHHGTNYDRHSIGVVQQQCEKRQMSPAIIVDCSHGNSQKDPQRQIEVLEAIADDLADTKIRGVMIESHLLDGKQDLQTQPLIYGCSITDGCLGWENTHAAIDKFSMAVYRLNSLQLVNEVV